MIFSNDKLRSDENSFLDTGNIKDYTIEPGTKIHLVIKKDNETNLTKELKTIGATFFNDVDRFASTFNQVSTLVVQNVGFVGRRFPAPHFICQELKKLVNEMSLDDIEYYDGYKSSMTSKITDQEAKWRSCEGESLKTFAEIQVFVD